MKLPQISLSDIKNALRDPSFIATLPDALHGDVQKYMSNPGCTCNMAIIQRIVKEAPDQLKAYYPTKDIAGANDAVKEMNANMPKIEHSAPQNQQVNQQAQIPATINNFSVINCSIGEVEERLKALPPGRKQIAMARYEDQVTVIINELDLGF
jgi:hypothetical protein